MALQKFLKQPACWGRFPWQYPGLRLNRQARMGQRIALCAGLSDQQRYLWSRGHRARVKGQIGYKRQELPVRRLPYQNSADIRPSRFRVQNREGGKARLCQQAARQVARGIVCRSKGGWIG